MHTLTILPSPGGQITGDPEGEYPYGTTVHLHAAPETGYRFVKWLVNGASELDITLFPERSKQFFRPVRWGDLRAENLIDLVELYFPKATAEEHLAIAYLCEERGLGERAQMHREVAPDAGGK